MHLSNVDSLTAERARAIVPFGLTERQARFVVTVMLHSGVFVGRQYAAFAGITHGQKVHDFVEKLLSRRIATAATFGPTGGRDSSMCTTNPCTQGSASRTTATVSQSDSAGPSSG